MHTLKKRIFVFLIGLAALAVIVVSVSGAMYTVTEWEMQGESTIAWAARTHPGPLVPTFLHIDRFIASRFGVIATSTYKDAEVDTVKRTFNDWVAGVSVQNKIFLLKGYERLLPHEYTHTLQWRRYGTLGFLARYFGAMPWLFITGRNTYWDDPLEVEARVYGDD